MLLTERATAYLEAAIEGALDELARTTKGGRNAALYKAACRLGGMVAAGVLDETWAHRQLYAVATEIGLVQDPNDGERSVLLTIRSGFQKGAQSPFEWPPDLPVEESIELSLKDRAEGLEDRVPPPMPAEEDSRAEPLRAKLVETDYVGRCQEALLRHSGPALELEDVLSRGISGEAIARFGVGRGIQYGRRGVVIPWWSRGKLWTLQYRHVDGAKPKYHWHEGLPAGRLFNSDELLSEVKDFLLIVEGALNAMVMWSHGVVPVIGLPTMNGWQRAFGPYVSAFEDVVVAVDYRASRVVSSIARDVPKARFWFGPADPDEFLQEVGVDAFTRSLEDAQPYGA